MKTAITVGEYYHVYNRGVDKRSIFEDQEDLQRFLQSMHEFNTTDPMGGIYARAHSKFRYSMSKSEKLVSFVAYCLNYNHYHFLIQPLTEKGLEKFMQRLSNGYTKFFNEKHERTGALFQGRYKRKHIETNEQLLHASFYINVNDRVHDNCNPHWFTSIPFSSFSQYSMENTQGIPCATAIILEQFLSKKSYAEQSEIVLPDILWRKQNEKLLAELLIE